MKSFWLLALVACINILFAILLIHKQNHLIKLLYTIQHLQEQQAELFEKKKHILYQINKEQQLSQVQSFAHKQLHMKPLKIKDIKTVTLQKE